MRHIIYLSRVILLKPLLQNSKKGANIPHPSSLAGAGGKRGRFIAHLQLFVHVPPHSLVSQHFTPLVLNERGLEIIGQLQAANFLQVLQKRTLSFTTHFDVNHLTISGKSFT